MTTTYRIAREISNEIVNVHNEMYEALKKRDIESFIKFANLEDNLKDSLISFGYETTFVYEEGSPMINCEGAIAFKVIGASISRIEEEN